MLPQKVCRKSRYSAIEHFVLTRLVLVGKLLGLLRAFPPNEPTKKRFVNDMVQWSTKSGEFPNGDPELHHVAGMLYAEGT